MICGARSNQYFTLVNPMHLTVFKVKLSTDYLLHESLKRGLIWVLTQLWNFKQVQLIGQMTF